MSSTPRRQQQQQQGKRGNKRKASDTTEDVQSNDGSGNSSSPAGAQPQVAKFKSKTTGKTYLIPSSSSYKSILRDPFISWCFKEGKWVDSRLNEVPSSSHVWSLALHEEMVNFFTIVILDDKEVAMISKMLGGRRVEGCSDYEHLSETCNLEDSTIRAYVKLGMEVGGHPFEDDSGAPQAPKSRAKIARKDVNETKPDKVNQSHKQGGCMWVSTRHVEGVESPVPLSCLTTNRCIACIMESLQRG